MPLLVTSTEMFKKAYAKVTMQLVHSTLTTTWKSSEVLVAGSPQQEKNLR